MAPGLVMIFRIYGAARTDAVSLAVMWGLLPLLVPALGCLLLGENAHWSLGMGAAIGFAGLIVLSLSREAAGTGSMAGNALVLLAVLCASFSQIVGRRMNRGVIPWFQVATSSAVRLGLDLCSAEPGLRHAGGHIDSRCTAAPA